MKINKLISLLIMTIILVSCGPSEEELAVEKKDFLHSVDSLLTVYEGQVNDYCNCLETKTHDDCKSVFHVSHETWMNLNRKADIAHQYVKVVSEITAIRDKTGALMDKGAHCAQAPNKAEAAALGITLHDESTDNISTSSTNSSSTNNTEQKTTTVKKTTKETKKQEDDDEHHSESKSENPY